MLEFVNGADVEQATTGLLNLLGGMMEQLANFFGTSVQFVQEHFTEYLLGFGKYLLIETCVKKLIGATAIFLIAALLSYAIVVVANANPSNIRNDETISSGELVKFILGILIIVTIIVTILIVIEIVKYAVAPEIYSAIAILEKLGYLGD